MVHRLHTKCRLTAPAIVLSGPAQRSLTLWPARSPGRQATLYTESSDSFVASAAASIASGWSEPVPGRELHPLKSSAFHGALFHQLSGTTRAHYYSAKSPLSRQGMRSPFFTTSTSFLSRAKGGVLKTRAVLSSTTRIFVK